MKTRFPLLALAFLAACSPPADQHKQAESSDSIGAGAERAAGAGTARAGVASADLALSKAPAAGARVTSPLSIEGTAPNDWYFEGQFLAQLVNDQGAVIAESPALPQSDWQKSGPVPFIADLVFDVDADTPATIVLQEDMSAEGRQPREKRIAVVLAQ